jgi:hypothetical protein
MLCPCIEVQQGHVTTPDAAGVEGDHIGGSAPAFERSPMAKDNFMRSGFALGVTEPGREAWRGAVEAFFAF